jgi:hypothetical protein
MATGADVIKGALRRLQVIEDETPIEPSEINDGLEDLNDFGSAHEVGFLELGFVPLALPANTINIPFQALGYFKDQLALYMAGQYGAPIPQSLVLSADKTMRFALNAFQRPIDVEFPDTLPVGAANECDSIINNEHFFPINSDENF